MNQEPIWTDGKLEDRIIENLTYCKNQNYTRLFEHSAYQNKIVEIKQEDLEKEIIENLGQRSRENAIEILSSAIIRRLKEILPGYVVDALAKENRIRWKLV